MCHQLKLIRGNQDYRTVGSEERRGRKLPHGIKSHDLVYSIAILKICGTFGYSSILLFFFGRCLLERTLVLMYGERIYTFSMFSFASDFNSEPDRFSF